MGCSCRRTSCRLQIEDIRDYFISQRKILWIIYRFVVALYCLIAVTLWIVVANTKYNVMLYLTTWTYVMLCLYTVLAAIGPLYFKLSTGVNNGDPSMNQIYTIVDTSEGDLDVRDDISLENANLDQHDGDNKYKHRVLSIFGMCLGNKREVQTKSISWGQCMYLVMWNTSASIASALGIAVTIVYYSAICHQDPTCHKYTNINVHALNSLFIFIDLLSSRPVGFCQILFPLVYGAVYVFFTLMFWATDHSHVIYTILNWNKAGRSVGWILGFLVVVFVVQVFIYIFNVLLKRCCSRFNATKDDIQGGEIVKN